MIFRKWIDHPRVDVAVTLAGAAAYLIYCLARPSVQPAGIAGTLAEVAGVVLGMFTVAYGFVSGSGSKRMGFLARHNRGVLNDGWRSVIGLPVMALLVSLLTLLLGDIPRMLAAALIGVASSGVVVAGARMYWIIDTSLVLSGRDAAPHEPPRIRSDIGIR